MPETPPPPAAWYPDPTVPKQQRYWNGAAWTEHVAGYRKTHPVRVVIITLAVVAVFATIVFVREFTTGTTPVGVVNVGECLGNNPDGYGADDEIEKVKVVPCAGDHFMEVFYVYEHATTETPGTPKFETTSAERCQDRVLDYYPNANADPDLRVFMLNPVKSSWAFDRTTACLLFEVDHVSGAAHTVRGPLNPGS